MLLWKAADQLGPLDVSISESSEYGWEIKDAIISPRCVPQHIFQEDETGCESRHNYDDGYGYDHGEQDEEEDDQLND